MAFDIAGASIQGVRPFDKLSSHEKKFNKIEKTPFGISANFYEKDRNGIKLSYGANFDSENNLCFAAAQTLNYASGNFDFDYHNKKIRGSDFVKFGTPTSETSWGSAAGDKGSTYCWGDCNKINIKTNCDTCSGEIMECSKGDCFLIRIWTYDYGKQGQISKSFQLGENIRKNNALLDEMNRQVLASRKAEREKLFEIYANDGESFRGDCGGNSFAGTYSKSASVFTVTGPKGTVYDRSKHAAIQRACR